MFDLSPSSPSDSHASPESSTTPVEVVDARERDPDPLPAPAAVAAGELDIEGDWGRVRRYSEAARQFGRAQVACQVLAGLELIELRKQNRVRAGRHVADGAPTFADLVAEHAGISHDTAHRWIAMAEGVRPRLKKLPGVGALFRELLEVPLHRLSVEQHHLLEQAVHKATDGMTQIEFLRELGIAKQPAGHGATGGDRGGRRPPKSLVPPSEEAMQAVARADWVQLETVLDASRANFCLLNDFEVEAQIAVFELHVKARRAWLRVPKKDRTPETYAAVADLFRVPLHAPMTAAQAAIRPATEA